MKLTPPLIFLRNLAKKYSSKSGDVEALQDISFTAEKGTFTAIVGKSGCGKSTLLYLIAGLIPKTRGEILIDGIPVSKPISNVGFAFQEPLLLNWRTNLENIKLPAEILRLDKEESDRKAKELINLVKLEGFEHRYPYELSGGMQQRVALARSLIHDPPLLFLDEPFGSLDAITREEMNTELLRMWGEERKREERKTILFVTHSIDEATFLADNVIILTPRPGKIAGKIEVNLPRPRNPRTRSSERFCECTLKIREKLGLVDTEM